MHRFKVATMGCGGCAKSVTRAIQAVAPNARVEVDLGAWTWGRGPGGVDLGAWTWGPSS